MVLPFLSTRFFQAPSQALGLTINAPTSLIAVGDCIILVQSVDAPTMPLLQSGFTSLLTRFQEGFDFEGVPDGTGKSIRISTKIATALDIGAVYPNQTNVSILRRTPGVNLAFSVKGAGSFDTSIYTRPVGAAYVAVRDNAIPSSSTVDGIGPNTEIVTSGGFQARVALWSGDFWPNTINLAAGSTSGSQIKSWLIVSKET